MKKCRYCDEEIQDNVLKCKHCGEFVTKEPFLPNRVFKFTLRWIVLPVLVGLYISFLWQWINGIHPSRVHLALPYAYEYKYLNATHDNPSRVVTANIPIKLTIDSLNTATLRLGLENDNIKSLKKVTFHLILPNDIKAIEYKGWTKWNDNQYYYEVPNINNALTTSFEQLRLVFTEPNKKYEVAYTITAEDTQFISRKFFIETYKPK